MLKQHISLILSKIQMSDWNGTEPVYCVFLGEHRISEAGSAEDAFLQILLRPVVDAPTLFSLGIAVFESVRLRS